MRRFLVVLLLLQSAAMAEPAVTPLEPKSNDELLSLLFQVESPLRVKLLTEGLRERYDKASPQDRERMVEGFCGSAELLFVPDGPLRGGRPEPAGDNTRYAQHAKLAGKVFPGPVAVDVLKRLLFEKAYWNSLDDYSLALLELPREAYGPETAAAALELHQHFLQTPPNPHLWCFGSPGERAVTVMGRSGEAGLEALKQIGWQSYDGVLAVGHNPADEAREMLLDLYREPDTLPYLRLRVLYVLSERHLRKPDDRLVQFFRDELPKFLRAPAGGEEWDVNTAVAAAGFTRDAYFLPYLEQVAGLARPDEVKQARAHIARAQEGAP